MVNPIIDIQYHWRQTLLTAALSFGAQSRRLCQAVVIEAIENDLNGEGAEGVIDDGLADYGFIKDEAGGGEHDFGAFTLQVIGELQHQVDMALQWQR